MAIFCGAQAVGSRVRFPRHSPEWFPRHPSPERCLLDLSSWFSGWVSDFEPQVPLLAGSEDSPGWQRPRAWQRGEGERPGAQPTVLKSLEGTC